MSSDALCVPAQSVLAHLCGIIDRMAKTASEREDDYKREVDFYLQAIMKAKKWSQSELGRQVGVRSTTINKALKRRHVIAYTTLLALEDRSRTPLPDALVAAAKALNDPSPADISAEAESFLQSSPPWQRMVELGRKLDAESDPVRKREIKQELEALIQKVG